MSANWQTKWQKGRKSLKPACSCLGLVSMAFSILLSRTLQNTLHDIEKRVIPRQLSQFLMSAFLGILTVSPLDSLGMVSLFQMFWKRSGRTLVDVRISAFSISAWIASHSQYTLTANPGLKLISSQYASMAHSGTYYTQSQYTQKKWFITPYSLIRIDGTPVVSHLRPTSGRIQSSVCQSGTFPDPSWDSCRQLTFSPDSGADQWNVHLDGTSKCHCYVLEETYTQCDESDLLIMQHEEKNSTSVLCVSVRFSGCYILLLHNPSDHLI